VRYEIPGVSEDFLVVLTGSSFFPALQ